MAESFSPWHGNLGAKQPARLPTASWPANVAVPFLLATRPDANCAEHGMPSAQFGSPASHFSRTIHQIVIGSPAGSREVRNVIEIPLPLRTRDAFPTTVGGFVVGFAVRSFHRKTSVVCLVVVVPRARHEREAPPGAPTPLLKRCISGFIPENTPSGFGYQAQTWSVTRSGCQNPNAAPVCGLFGAHASWLAAKVNVPSL